MKRLFFLFTITLAALCTVQAAQVNETEARQIADKFFGTKSARFSASAGQAVTRLAYTAEAGRFFVFDRSAGSGFVVIAGDDRLPQVLGYSLNGTFSAGNIPLAMQDWMAEMNREIAFLQSHKGAKAHHPIQRANPVSPLMTTRWNQDWPYNLLCPTYTISGDVTERAVTGCVATAMAQIMNYYKWPERGNGSHTYNCNVNDTDPTTLTADFSQSVYEWDLMLDDYNMDSSEESCYAVAKLMSDAGISIDMNYGDSSGASESAVLTAITDFFGYSSKRYLLQRDLYSASEWDQLLYDEISAGRPVLYCGYTYTQGSLGGHAFVFDGVDARGYFHVNWGWGGSSDGYFMASALAPGSGMNFKYGQDGIFGFIPAPDEDVVPDVLYIRGLLHPDMYSAPRNSMVSLKFSDIYVEGNMLDTVGYEEGGWRPMPYDMIPMELRVIGPDGESLQSHQFTYKVLMNSWFPSAPNIEFTPDASLADGEYLVKIAYSSQKDENFDTWVCDEYGNDVYCKMIVSGDMVYLKDCFLSSKYNLESISVAQSVCVDDPFDVDVKLANPRGYGPPGGPGQAEFITTGSVHLTLMKNGEVVATSEAKDISIPKDSTLAFSMQMTAPSEWGRYELALVDDCGRVFYPESGWLDTDVDGGIISIIISPKSDVLVEDFESMTANGKTNDTNIQGRFTLWNFNKSGVRAPGEGKCNGTNAVMMKKPSTFYSVEPIRHNFFLAEATFFNSAAADAKYTLEYSVDNGATWTKANTVEGDDAALVPGTSITRVFWQLDLTTNDPAVFRVSMTGGGSASTYVDDFTLRYNDPNIAGDVNLDGQVNITDLNAIIHLILNGMTNDKADLNGDGDVNISDVNMIINYILSAS